MKFSNRFAYFSRLSNVALLSAGLMAPLVLRADDSPPAGMKAAVGQRVFSTPDEAVAALRNAVEANDKTAMNEMFGPIFKQLSTGDEVLDANHAKGFAAVLAQGCTQVPDGENKITLELGTNNWPMPIPLVKAGGQWYFDTAAGREEIINRHVGRDELHAIGVCRAYVAAQRQYANMNPKVGGGANYAQKFKSSPGMKDGLYWPQVEGEPASPFGPLVAEAHLQGYATATNSGTGPQPFHGYYFRILTRQGEAATGGKRNYVSQGVMVDGFALVAYPERWDVSGVMTFIVNQEGKVYQRNLGAMTSQIAGKMKEYNPDTNWTLVTEDGILDAVQEK